MTTTTKNLVVLGAGTAGTMVVSLRRALPTTEWTITVVDRDDIHDYQPGYLFLPFGMTAPEQVRRQKHPLITDGVVFVLAEVDRVDPDAHVVHLADGRELPYDQLVIATGTTPRPDQTPGTLGPQWHREVGEFYTLRGRARTARADGGVQRRPARRAHHRDAADQVPRRSARVHLPRRRFLTKRGVRDRTEIVFVTPPMASHQAGGEQGARLDARAEERRRRARLHGRAVDQETKVPRLLRRARGRLRPAVTIPLNMGADFVARQALGDELNYVPVDKHTMQSTAHPDIWALGDAGNLPTSKAGSVAHFSVEVFVDNFLEQAAGKPMTHSFDGHANCFVESGHGKALLLDFNYDTEPLTGHFPIPRVGPMKLLGESRANHLGKLAFRHIYWNALLPGRPLGLPSEMSMSGKNPA